MFVIIADRFDFLSCAEYIESDIIIIRNNENYNIMKNETTFSEEIIIQAIANFETYYGFLRINIDLFDNRFDSVDWVKEGF